MAAERESLRDRLRRLRRDADPAAGAAEQAASAPASEAAARAQPADVAGQLARRAQRMQRASAAQDAHAPGGGRALSAGAPADLVAAADGSLARVHRFALDHRHGARRLADALAVDRSLLSDAGRDPRLAQTDPSRAVFLDTETSGLSGGAGTYVFLVGLGWFDDGAFHVWQGFLADPRGERALLDETCRRIAAASCVVSFFGKAFDRHRLEDKMRVHGLPPPFAERPHLDLYYPLRRRHRGRFGDCRLKTLERELAGVVRDEDLPGSFAPAAWFDFLAGRAHRLEGVFRHNLDDVLSLAALLPSATER